MASNQKRLKTGIERETECEMGGERVEVALQQGEGREVRVSEGWINKRECVLSRREKGER